MIYYEKSQGIQSITLSINEANSFSLESFREFRVLLDRIQIESSPLLVIKSSMNGVFSQGLDLKQVNEPKDEKSSDEFIELFFGILDFLYFHPAILISEINGHALGYGAMLALVSDFRISIDGFRFGLPESKLGIRAPSFISLLLSDIIGMKKAQNHIFDGTAWKTREAFDLGLIDEIYTDENSLKNGTNKLIQRLKRNSLSAMMDSKLALRELRLFCKDLIQKDKERTLQSLKSPDAQEGLASALVGRRPLFPSSRWI